MNSLSARLKFQRKKRGLSQGELAKLCDVSQPTIANWERGGHIPRQAALTRLGSALNTDTLWLISGERPAAANPANLHLSKPIHHIPVYEWANNIESLRNAQPHHYVTLSLESGEKFGLISPGIKEFPQGTILVFDTASDDESGECLVQRGDILSLSLENDGARIGRLILSLQSH